MVLRSKCPELDDKLGRLGAFSPLEGSDMHGVDIPKLSFNITLYYCRYLITYFYFDGYTNYFWSLMFRNIDIKL